MAYLSPPATTLKPFILHQNPTPHFFNLNPSPLLTKSSNQKFNLKKNVKLHRSPFPYRSTSFATIASETETDYETEDDYDSDLDDRPSPSAGAPPSLRRQRRRYRKAYPGEKEGITEEMRFAAMKLRNDGKGRSVKSCGGDDEGEKEDGDTWQPSMDGFLKYLVDSELVFTTVERIVDESSDVSYVYFRKTGLERSECVSKDLEWLRERGNVIPEPSSPGITYVEYLKELAENSPPLFLCHFYNIYFSHIAGGQVIAKQVSKKLLEGRELEFFKWEGDAEELLRGVREKLNALGEHWSRDEKNKGLREATKAFRFLGQIVRLIIL